MVFEGLTWSYNEAIRFYVRTCVWIWSGVQNKLIRHVFENSTIYFNVQCIQIISIFDS